MKPRISSRNTHSKVVKPCSNQLVMRANMAHVGRGSRPLWRPNSMNVPRSASLTSIRGIAAWWVAFHNMRVYLPLAPDGLLAAVAQRGYLAVDLFFVLSGFVLQINYGRAMRNPSWTAIRAFAIARAARVYPLHLFMCLVFLLNPVVLRLHRPWIEGFLRPQPVADPELGFYRPAGLEHPGVVDQRRARRVSAVFARRLHGRARVAQPNCGADLDRAGALLSRRYSMPPGQAPRMTTSGGWVCPDACCNSSPGWRSACCS